MSRQATLLLAIALVSAGCGGIGTASRTQSCQGCNFILATTASGAILASSLPDSAHQFPVAQTPGPANSIGIDTGPITTGAVPVYVSDPAADAIRAYSLNLSSGTLSPASPASYALGASSGAPGQIAAANQVLYVAESGGFVATFAIQPDGTLRQTPGSPFAAGPGTSHLCVEVSPTAGDALVFAANSTDPAGTISAFVANPAGQLTPVPGSPFASGGDPQGLGCGGTVLYATLPGQAAVAAFSIADSGALAPLPGSPYAAGAGASSLTQCGQFLCVEDSAAHSISALPINTQTGALGPAVSPPFSIPGVQGELLTRFGDMLVPVANGGLVPFTINITGGVLTPASPLFPASSPLAATTLFIPVLDPT